MTWRITVPLTRATARWRIWRSLSARRTGAASGDLTLDIKGSLFPVANRTHLTFDLSGTSGRMTLSNHLRNQGTLTFDLSLSLAPSSAPVSAPPKDAVLTPLDELN